MWFNGILYLMEETMDNKKTIAQAAFEFYLLKNEYSEVSDKGNDSTVFDYSKRVMRICKQEGYSSLDDFLPNLIELITEIDNGSDRTKSGIVLDKNDKSALRKFRDFILQIF